MNLKTKALGLVAGTALTLSLASGTLAQAVGGDTSVDLIDNGDGVCYVETATGDINLGTWEWDGDSYELQPSTNNGSITFDVTQDVRPTPAVNCSVAVTVTNLTLASNPPIAFGASNLSVISGSSSSGTPYTVVTPTGAGADLVLGATLLSVPSTQPLGLYTGTVTVDTVSASI